VLSRGASNRLVDFDYDGDVDMKDFSIVASAELLTARSIFWIFTASPTIGWQEHKNPASSRLRILARRTPEPLHFK